MKKKVLPVIICLSVLLGSCQKSVLDALTGTESNYMQFYGIVYHSPGDSFVAYATPKINHVSAYLTKHESITFNGRSHDNMIDNTFYWSGKGKIDAAFVLKKKSTQLTNQVTLSTIPEFEIICPDTLYKTKKFVIRVTNYIPVPNHANVSIQTAKSTGSNSFKGDSVSFSPQGFKNYPVGNAKVLFYHNISQGLQQSDNNEAGEIEYRIHVEKNIWVSE